MTACIEARGLSLKVPNYVQRERNSAGWVREILSEAFQRSVREYRTILEGLDFQLKEGDRIALMGRNGAGKTTLLRILSGAFQPTSGTLSITGTRQALLNLSLGFNAQATVRENIYLRATAMGLKISDMRGLVESILDFADLRDVAQHRLLTLSSGQRMRLGFAISTAVQQDVMLMDEWFGAGDAHFVDKARTRLNDRVDGCKILVLASHNFQTLRKVCTRGLVLEGGHQVFLGPIEEAINAYKAIYQSAPGYVPRRAKRKHTGRAKARATKMPPHLTDMQP
jgi:lipopolysaccharide transport system ATP-binding protein